MTSSESAVAPESAPATPAIVPGPRPATALSVAVAVEPRYDLQGSVGALRRGYGDPTYRRDATDAIWMGCRVPDGRPGTLRLHRTSPETVTAAAWGPGADWLLASVPDLLGLGDSEEHRAEFAEIVAAQGNPILVQSLRRNPGLRVVRTGRVFDSLVPAVLEQRVTVKGAHRSYRLLVRKHGVRAPGAPAELDVYCPPPVRGWALIPSWEWHRSDVDNARSRAIMGATRVAARLEETVGMSRDEAARRIRTVPGIGVWTAAEVMHRAHGDPDAISVGDLHLPRIVCTALGGPAAARGADDDRMLELLEPYRGHRYRVSSLLYR
jgi:3-methyladenine DNA glycosylase/8-oxoguanine DNA glycosylase